MPRLKLRPLPRYPFATDITVRTTDLNYGAHLGNDRLLALIHEARVAYLASHGWAELDCGGVGLILSDAALVLRREAFADDVLRFDVGAVEVARTTFRLAYRVVRKSDGVTVALAETGMAGYDYARSHPVPLPEPVAATLRKDAP